MLQLCISKVWKEYPLLLHVRLFFLSFSISDNYWYTNTKSESKYWSTADNRITRLIHELISPLGNIVKNVKRIDHSILLPGLLTHQIYVADLLIYPTVGSSLFKFGSDTFQKNSKIVIFLIHPPNHYDQSGTALIGREAMRSRQLKKLGFKVVNLNYSIANKLLRIPIKLQEFLQREYERALKEWWNTCSRLPKCRMLHWQKFTNILL